MVETHVLSSLFGWYGSWISAPSRSGGIGRRARLRTWCPLPGVEVQILSRAPCSIRTYGDWPRVLFSFLAEWSDSSLTSPWGLYGLCVACLANVPWRITCLKLRIFHFGARSRSSVRQLHAVGNPSTMRGGVPRRTANSLAHPAPDPWGLDMQLSFWPLPNVHPLSARQQAAIRLVLSLVVSALCLTPVAVSPLRAKPPAAAARYMGRTIAATMHYTGADWLMRESRQREEDCKRLLKELRVKPGQFLCDMGSATDFTRSNLPDSPARRARSTRSTSSKRCSICSSDGLRPPNWRTSCRYWARRPTHACRRIRSISC